MSAGERGGLKAAFAGFKKPSPDETAEIKLLGRTTNPQEIPEQVANAGSYQVATPQLPGLVPRPLLQKEPVRQLSFRCPASLAAELRRKAAFNQLEQQEIIIEGLNRILGDLQSPPSGWTGA